MTGAIQCSVPKEIVMSATSLEGGCQCGNIRYRVFGDPVMAALCHCAMCRRASAAPMVVWAMYQEAQLAFTGASPATYESSVGAQRGFCPTCGTPICFKADYIPGLIDAEFPPIESLAWLQDPC